MNSILLYLAKTILVSGFLYGYYWCFLRNASFHQYNRGYLLGITAISLALPLLHLPVPGPGGEGGSHATIAILHALTAGNWGEADALAKPGGVLQVFLNWPFLAASVFLLVTGMYIFFLLRSLSHIRRLSRQWPQERVGGVRIFFTLEPGTPFSFLNRIFWNSGLDLNSPRGSQVFRHELYHVRQKHTLDILALELVRAAFWCNPFFHFIRKEIKATHEFLADRYAITANDHAGDKYEYAELLVWQTLHNHPSTLVHSFFNTHLKRRIAMLTQLKNTRPAYFSRIMVLPLVFLLFCAFATSLQKPDHPAGRPSAKTLTVIIDAGHGGSDPGGISSGGINEKDLTLAIAKKVKQLSSTYNINVLMTREKDEMPGNKTTKEEGLHYRTDFANEHKADLFISIHINKTLNDSSDGIQVYLSPQNPYFQKSVALGSAMIEEMKRTYPTDDQLIQRKQGIWVLQGSAMPAILMECGSLDNEKDLAFISNAQNQESVARSILQGILRYEESLASTSPTGNEGSIVADPTASAAPAIGIGRVEAPAPGSSAPTPTPPVPVPTPPLPDTR